MRTLSRTGHLQPVAGASPPLLGPQPGAANVFKEGWRGGKEYLWRVKMITRRLRALTHLHAASCGLGMGGPRQSQGASFLPGQCGRWPVGDCFFGGGENGLVLLAQEGFPFPEDWVS